MPFEVIRLRGRSSMSSIGLRARILDNIIRHAGRAVRQAFLWCCADRRVLNQAWTCPATEVAFVDVLKVLNSLFERGDSALQILSTSDQRPG